MLFKTFPVQELVHFSLAMLSLPFLRLMLLLFSFFAFIVKACFAI